MIDLNQEKFLHLLVESELSLEEENDAIMQCEQDARLWRSVALAFIEQRRIADALNHWNDEASADAMDNFSNTNLVVANKWSVGSMSKAIMAVAALLLLSIGVGGTFGWHFGNQYGENANGSEPAPHLAATNPVSVHVIYPNGQAQPSSTVFSFGEPILNASAKDVLRNAGYEVEEVASWHLVGDGQQQAVPSRELRLTSTR